MAARRIHLTRSLLLVLLAACLHPAAGCGPATLDASRGALATVEAEIGGRTFTLDTALTGDERFQGLSGVASLPPDGGMLFVFPDVAERAFVMRDCLIPLDIVFVDPGGRVARTAHMPLDPPGTPERNLTRHESRYPVQFAIELPGGTLETLDLADGDRVKLPLDALRSAAR